MLYWRSSSSDFVLFLLVKGTPFRPLIDIPVLDDQSTLFAYQFSPLIILSKTG